jgi:hypothetical protein
MGNKDTAELLRAKGANAKDNQGHTPLRCAALTGGHVDVAELFRQYGGHE